MLVYGGFYHTIRDKCDEGCCSLPTRWGSCQVLPAALVYSRVRILGSPASVADMVLQAACLGARDSLTPLGVVLVAGCVNAVGDWFTVCRLNMGVFGAAAATASSEAVSMVLLSIAVWRAQGELVHDSVPLKTSRNLRAYLVSHRYGL